MRTFRTSALAGVGAAALAVALAVPGIASADDPSTLLGSELTTDVATASPGDIVHVSPVLISRQDQLVGGGQFVVTTDPQKAEYVGGTDVAGVPGGCEVTDDGATVVCHMSIHNTNKGITLDYKIKEAPATFTFVGTNGAGDSSAPLSVTVGKPMSVMGSLGSLDLFGSLSG